MATEKVGERDAAKDGEGEAAKDVMRYDSVARLPPTSGKGKGPEESSETVSGSITVNRALYGVKTDSSREHEDN
jgi:hypothetical protein